jgi:hypothetical protein
VADDRPEYRAFLMGRPCRCQPCIAPVIVHHNTFGDVHAGDRPLPPKALGGKRGKGQRASDTEGMSLCHRHHGQLHSLTGYFAGWDKSKLRDWQNAQVAALQAEYEAHLEKNPPPAMPAPPKRSAARSGDWSTERAALVEYVRDFAGQRHLTPDAVAAVSDLAEVIAARPTPFAARSS